MFADGGFQMIIEKANGFDAYISERTDEAVFFKDPAKQAVVFA